MFIWEASQLWGKVKQEKKVPGVHLPVLIIMWWVTSLILPILTKLPMPTIILSSLTTKKAAIKKYLNFLGFELVTMIFAAKHANHWTREPSCQEVDLKDAIFAQGHLLIQNLRLRLVFCFSCNLIGKREG